MLLFSSLATLSAAPAFAQAKPIVTNITFPILVGGFVPCANNGAGEGIHLSGTAHFLVVESVDESGGTHFVLHDNYQAVSGLGLISGDRYRGIAAATMTSHNFDPFVGPPYELTLARNLIFVGQGPGNNFILSTRIHFTVNAVGELVRSSAGFSIECR